MLNLLFTHWIPQWYGASHELNLPGPAKPVVTEVGKITAIWAVQAALLSGIVLVLVCGYRNIRGRLAEEVGRRWAGYSRGDEHRL